MKTIIQHLCFAVGSVALAFGVLGIFVPMLPTTPFLLLAAACFVRSSERTYRWLLDHERLGCYVRDFVSGKGIPLAAKRVAIITMWVTTQFSWITAMVGLGVSTTTVSLAVVLVVVPALVHWYIGYRIPTREDACPPTRAHDRLAGPAASLDVEGGPA
jgi:hypothetical protein